MGTNYYTYMLRCDDNSVYTGITTDVKRRFEEHLSAEKGAKYTKRHKPIKIEAVWQSNSKSLALKLEYRIKQLPKSQKELLITENQIEVFGEKINPCDYSRVKFLLNS